VGAKDVIIIVELFKTLCSKKE